MTLPSKEPENMPRTKRRSCRSYGCMTSIALFVILALWIGSGLVFWKHCRIELPDGSGSVVYMARPHKDRSAEWDRKVRIETSLFHSIEKWIPCDPTGGADPVNVYWYPARDKSGPYLRFNDPIWEYLVDLRHGTALLMARHQNGSAYVGEVVPGKEETMLSGPTMEDGKPLDGSIIAEICERPGRRLESRIASHQGTYIGRIEYPFNRFVSSRESPETVIPEH